jgi:hypothetical protein
MNIYTQEELTPVITHTFQPLITNQRLVYSEDNTYTTVFLKMSPLNYYVCITLHSPYRCVPQNLLSIILKICLNRHTLGIINDFCLAIQVKSTFHPLIPLNETMQLMHTGLEHLKDVYDIFLNPFKPQMLIMKPV